MKNLCSDAACGSAVDVSGGGPTLFLPLAGTINARTRYASSPGAVAAGMGLPGAMARIEQAVAANGKIATVDIGGMGDPLADLELTQAVTDEIHKRYPALVISIRTLGIGGADCAVQLYAAGIRRVRLQVNAVDVANLERLYAWIRSGRKTLRLAEAGAILLDEQKTAVAAFRAAGLAVTVHTVIYPGMNDRHAGEIAGTMAALGVESMTIEPYRPEAGADVVLPAPSAVMMADVLASCAVHIAVEEIKPAPMDEVAMKADVPKPTRGRPNVAVVSTSGMEVDLHLGQAKRILVYGPRGDGLVCLLETRQAPEAGGGGNRWLNLAARLPDCFALLAASAGENPRRVLAEQGIRVFITEGSIEGCVDVLYGGGKKGKGCRK